MPYREFEGVGTLGAGRGNRDHAPSIALPEMRRSVFRAEKRSENVDVLNASPFVDVDLLDRGRRSRDARIVNEAIEAAELLDRLFDRCRDRRLVRHVRLDRQRISSVPTKQRDIENQLCLDVGTV